MKEKSTKIVGNLSMETRAEMFLFLNLRPSFYVRLYRYVIHKGRPEKSINLSLQSKILMIAAKIINKAKDDFKVKAKKIFEKITSVLGFNHIFSYLELNKNTLSKGKLNL